MKFFGRKNNNNDFLQLLPQAITMLKKNIIDPFFGDNNYERYVNEMPPLRSEIFTREKLEQHAI